MQGKRLDLTNEPLRRCDTAPSADASSDRGQRRYVGIHFVCCGVYTRIYINRPGTAYEGNCPKCSRPVRLKVGPDGTDQRFFSAY